MFGPPGSLTEASLQSAGGAAPAAWGMFPRAVLHLLQLPGLGRLHASAVEVYQEKAYDLLADRAQLAVGVQKTGRKVAGVVSVPTPTECTLAPGAEQNAANEEAFATVGETLWELATPADVARLARMVELTRVAHACSD